jgi:hypothetical protein
MDRAFVRYLRAKAERCRELAETASDGEAAIALRQMADDMEAAATALGSADGNLALHQDLPK